MAERNTNHYFKWLCNFVYHQDSNPSYSKLLEYLYEKPFLWILPLDQNRYSDGINMRENYYRTHTGDHHTEKVGDCSILEMMVALSNRLEDQIMQDHDIGNRTPQWFWQMVMCLGLGKMTDDRFDPMYCDQVIDIFLSRTYQKNGRGGLFTTKDPEIDMAKAEIWYQAQWYLQGVLEDEGYFQKEGEENG